MKNTVFITGAGKSEYFTQVIAAIGGRIVNRKTINRHSFTGLKQAFFHLSKDEVDDLSDFYRKVKAEKAPSIVYRKILDIRARLYFSRYYTFFSTIDEQYFSIWNGYYLADKALVLAGEKHGKTPIYFENGLLPNTTTVDAKGINYANSLPRTPEFYRQLSVPADFSSGCELVVRPLAKGKQEVESVVLPKRYVFVPFQVETDTQILVYGGWVKNMRHLYAQLQAVVAGLDDKELVFVIKEHPTSLERYDDLQLEKNPRLIFANGNNTQDLIADAEAVITINSTVGIEALMLQKKVISLGQAFYTIEGIVQHAGSQQALLDVIRQLPAWSPDAELVRKFINYLQEQYLVKGSWRTPAAQHFQALREKLQAITGQ